jgi:CTP synthase
MSDEQKSKPTQHSVQVLRSLGLFPDFLFCRSKEMLRPETIEKLSLFSQVKKERVISVFDVPNMFHVPLVLQEQGFCK